MAEVQRKEIGGYTFASIDSAVTVDLVAASVLAAIAGTAGVNAVASQRIRKCRVTSLFLIGTTAGTVEFDSISAGAVTTKLTGAIPLPATGGFVLPHNPEGWFETLAGEKLTMTLSGTGQVSGAFSYQQCVE